MIAMLSATTGQSVKSRGGGVAKLSEQPIERRSCTFAIVTVDY